MKIIDMKKVYIESLNLLKKEENKRHKIYRYGVDLCNYENNYAIVALNLLVHEIFSHNKKVQRSCKEIKELLEWWLYENIDKKIFIGKEKYNVEKASDFIKFLLER